MNTADMILQWVFDGESTEGQLLSVSWEERIDPLDLSQSLDDLKEQGLIDQHNGQITLTRSGKARLQQLRQQQNLVATASPKGVRLLKNGIAMTFTGSEVQEVRYLDSGATVIVAGGAQ